MARSLPRSAWPTADREAWELVCRPGRRLSRGGAASGMKPISRDMHARHYGYFLGCCAGVGLLDLNAEAAGHVTPTAINRFLSDLQNVGSVTRANYLTKVRRMAELLAPQREFSWLREIEAGLKEDARPQWKANRVVESDRLLALGIELMRRAEKAPSMTANERRRTYRDGLMIALLALCPVRLKNLVGLRIGQQIREVDGSWWIVLDGSETKTGRADERPIAPILTPFIRAWIDRWRPSFSQGNDWFWPSWKARLAYTYVGTVISRVTHRELGVTVNPHLFRDSAVLTVANHAGAHMEIASGLLQHTDPRVTEEHYNKGASTEAARRFQKLLGL